MTDLLREGIGISAIILGLPLGVAALLSFFVSLLCAATQIQEPIIPFALRVLSAFGMLYVFQDTFLALLINYWQKALRSLVLFG